MFFVILLLLTFSNLIHPSAITYEFNGGRFGDCLSTYCKAKWFSFKYKIPLLYKPFQYSDQLMMHREEQAYDEQQIANFDAIIKVKTEDDIIKNKNKNVLFVSNFYSQTPGLYEYQSIDRKWGTVIKKMLTPTHAHSALEKTDANSITVALHVRKGGGFDKPLSTDHNKSAEFSDQIWPTKFPPDSYYIEQLQTLRKLIGPQTILDVYLFTDAPDPGALAKKYADIIQDTYAYFHYRESGNAHDTNVVEDYYAMACCDCLIRSSSLIAKAAQLLGSHHIILYPIHGYWNGQKVIIDPVGIIMKGAN